MLDDLVDQEFPAPVVNDLVHRNSHAPVGFEGESFRIDARIQSFELPPPVLSYRSRAEHPAPFHAVRPIDIGMHRRQHLIDLPPVESRIHPAQQINLCRSCLDFHAIRLFDYLTRRARYSFEPSFAPTSDARPHMATSGTKLARPCRPSTWPRLNAP